MRDLVQRAQEEDPEAGEEMVERYRPLVNELARARAQIGTDLHEELIATGLLELWTAIQKYDPKRGEFIAFARRCVSRAMGEFCGWYLRGCREKSVHSRLRRLVQAQEYLVGDRERLPTASELAVYLDWPEWEVVRLLGVQAQRVIPLREDPDEPEPGTRAEAVDGDPTPEAALDENLVLGSWGTIAVGGGTRLAPILGGYLQQVLAPGHIPEVARLCGVREETVEEWVRGARQPFSLDYLFIIAHVTLCPVEELVARYRRLVQ